MTFLATHSELTECDREAIHQIAAVQPFGGLIKLNSDWRIGHRSHNCADILGIDSSPSVGTDLADVFTPAAMEALKSALVRLASSDETERLFGVELVAGSGLFDCAIHAVNERIVVEFEPHDECEFVNHISLIAPMVAQLDAIRQIGPLCTKAASMVRQMLGYDRVMVYRFHADESGEVIAEDAREDLEPYLGLRYPKSDIPQQARDLFRRNRVRVIADVEAAPSPIDPPVAFGNRPLDMSMSVLRAHSQMHLKYLTNMGVKATLTLAIVRQGKLWGMISCHHMEPKLPSFSLRTVAESFAQMFSLILDRMLIDHSEKLRARGVELHNQLMRNLADGVSLGANVAMVAEMLDGLIPHDGLTLQVAGEVTSYGAAPSDEEFAAIAPDIATAQISEAYGTTSMAHHLPGAKPFATRAAGALIVPISRDPDDCLVLWRKPLTRKVMWAGDPSRAKIETAGGHLEPRDSFAAWAQTVEGHCEEWSKDDLDIADGLRVTLLEVILRMSEEVARERNRAQEQQELLIGELNHRVRNILNLIRSLVSQSQHDAIDVENFASVISGRITALAAAHDNITRQSWSPAPLAKLFETEIEAYLTGQSDRFVLTGERVLITPDAYTVLALVVHEMMTNSAKYGSLCDRSGSVKVHVSRTPRGDLSISWRETGGPPVKTPTRRGFGSTIIERSIPFELGGQSDLRFQLAGLEADFLVPLRYVSNPGAGQGHTFEEAPGNDNGNAVDQRVAIINALPGHALVVEDSMIIALDTEENLKRLGVSSIDVEANVAGALAAIDKHQPDFAIIDFNLGNESSMPIIEELTMRGVPFVLATGYGELAEKNQETAAMATLRKPYGRAEIAGALDTYRELALLKASANPARSA